MSTLSPKRSLQSSTCHKGLEYCVAITDGSPLSFLSGPRYLCGHVSRIASRLATNQSLAVTRCSQSSLHRVHFSLCALVACFAVSKALSCMSIACHRLGPSPTLSLLNGI